MEELRSTEILDKEIEADARKKAEKPQVFVRKVVDFGAANSEKA